MSQLSIAMADDQLSHPRIHTWNSPRTGGFTLIELLVVIVIMSLLAGLALPSFLTQVRRSRQASAIAYLGSINRAQQAHYLERQSFSSDIASLGTAIQMRDRYYTYAISTPETNYSEATATPKQASPALKGYLGVVYVKTENGDRTVDSLLCQSETNTPPTVNIAGPPEQPTITGCNTL